ncbi:helix-turn-helix domain-containing protein, partial [Micromonospora rifamycinica]
MTGPGRQRTGTGSEPPIGRRIAELRARRGMSQQVFADRIGKSKSW